MSPKLDGVEITDEQYCLLKAAALRKLAGKSLRFWPEERELFLDAAMIIETLIGRIKGAKL